MFAHLALRDPALLFDQFDVLDKRQRLGLTFRGADDAHDPEYEHCQGKQSSDRGGETAHDTGNDVREDQDQRLIQMEVQIRSTSAVIGSGEQRDQETDQGYIGDDAHGLVIAVRLHAIGVKSAEILLILGLLILLLSEILLILRLLELLLVFGLFECRFGSDGGGCCSCCGRGFISLRLHSGLAVVLLLPLLGEVHGAVRDRFLNSFRCCLDSFGRRFYGFLDCFDRLSDGGFVGPYRFLYVFLHLLCQVLCCLIFLVECIRRVVFKFFIFHP